jgi:hypothetical protein
LIDVTWPYLSPTIVIHYTTQISTGASMKQFTKSNRELRQILSARIEEPNSHLTNFREILFFWGVFTKIYRPPELFKI